MTKKIAIGALKFALAVAILYWLWQSDRVDFSIFKKILNPIDLAILIGLAFTSLFFFSYRLHLLLRDHGFGQSYFQAWRLAMMGLFFNYTLPGGTGGDLAKIYYLAKSNAERRGLVVGLVVLDRLLGLYGMVAMAMVSFVLRPTAMFGEPDLWILFGMTTTVFLVLTGIIWWAFKHAKRPREVKQDWLKKVYDIVVLLPNKKLFIKALCVTWLSQIASVLILFFGATAAGYQNLDMLSFFVVAPLGFILTAIPISPGGIGVGQVAFYALFKVYTDSSSDLGPSVVTLYQVLLFVISLSGLYYYLRMGKR